MAQAQEQSFTFTVGATPSLHIRHAAGNVSIVAAEQHEITIRATKKPHRSLFRNPTSADFDAVHVETTQDGDSVSVTVRYDQRATMTGGISVDLQITMPANTALDFSIAAGTIDLRGTTGTLRGESNAGTITGRDITLADGSQLTNNAGSITLAGSLAPGASVDMRVNAGKISLQLPATTAALLDASASVGEIKIVGFPIRPERRIVEQRARGDLAPSARGTLRLRADVGSISLKAV